VNEARSIELPHRARWAEATLAALQASLVSDPTLATPEIAVIRVGEAGVELLLHAPCPTAPEPFEVKASGLLWLVGPTVTLKDLLEKAISAQCERPILVGLGTDEEGSYFSPKEDLPIIRLEDGEFGPFCDRIEWIGIDRDQGARSPALFGAPLVLVEHNDAVLIEPFGLQLNKASEAVEPSFPPAAPTSTEVPPDAEDALDHAQLDIELQPLRLALVPPGPVEVRILRESPDLVGRLLEEPRAEAVEFVAYLATHQFRTSTTRLRDALGTPRAKVSQSTKTVWNAASSARRALGTQLVPPASGNQLYVLGDVVSCDWNRLQALVATASSPASDHDRRRDALIAALDLVDGVPGFASKRYAWLDAEGLLTEISREVVATAHGLANFALEDGDETLARWAISKGRLLSPRDDELARDEARLSESGPQGTLHAALSR
jgi:hypothetical protein